MKCYPLLPQTTRWILTSTFKGYNNVFYLMRDRHQTDLAGFICKYNRVQARTIRFSEWAMSVLPLRPWRWPSPQLLSPPRFYILRGPILLFVHQPQLPGLALIPGKDVSCQYASGAYFLMPILENLKPEPPSTLITRLPKLDPKKPSPSP